MFPFAISLLAWFHLHLTIIKNKRLSVRTHTCACIPRHTCTCSQRHADSRLSLLSWGQENPNSIFLTTSSSTSFLFSFPSFLFFLFFLFFLMQKLKSQMAVSECGHFPASPWQSYSAHGEKHELHLAWKMVGWHCQPVVFVGRERILVTGRQTCCLSNLACLGSLSGPDRGNSEEDSQHSLGLVSCLPHQRI